MERWDCLTKTVQYGAFQIPFMLEDDDDFEQAWEIAQQMQAIMWKWA